MNIINNTIESGAKKAVSQTTSWNAVFAVALAVAGLITSEFLPVSLLTPMAKDLGITEGIAGQAISVTAGVGMLASLLTAVFTRTIDRRKVLLFFGVLQICSNILVSWSPNFLILLTGRILLGISLGGFWGMLAATAMRLVSANMVPKALSIIFASVSLATVVAAPMGSFLGQLIGWRNVFTVATGLGIIAFIWQATALPAMPVEKAAKLNTILRVLHKPAVKSGMLATLFSFMAYASLFTYLRPFLEKITGVNATQLSLILLGFGFANLTGASLARHLLKWNLYGTLAIMPTIMGIASAGLVLSGHFTPAASVLTGIWGMALGVVQLGWTAWLTRIAPDEAESAGGIQIAVIQLAIMTGAACGGLVFDLNGVKGVFILSSGIAFLAALCVAITSQKASTEKSGIK